jgi:hypothetical protein
MRTTRRVRHDVADAAVLMVFSPGTTIALAGAIALRSGLG